MSLIRSRRPRPPRRPLGRVLVATAAAAAACAGGVASDSVDAVTRATHADGQWVWSRADSGRFVEARHAVAALVPGVWVATVAVDADTITLRLALSPHAAGSGPVVAVVRFDDAFHRAWDVLDDETLARAVGRRLTALVAALGRGGAEVGEIQLDYDCPERRLTRWATLVRALGRGPLADRPLWVTSLPAHVRHVEYGRLFRGAAAGHVVQLFDTGERLTATSLAALAADLDRQRLPFRFGVGAFERVPRATRGMPAGGAPRTEHRAWFAAAPRLARSRWYRGTWVFPSGQQWLAYRAPAPQERP